MVAKSLRTLPILFSLFSFLFNILVYYIFFFRKICKYTRDIQWQKNMQVYARFQIFFYFFLYLIKKSHTFSEKKVHTHTYTRSTFFFIYKNQIKTEKVILIRVGANLKSKKTKKIYLKIINFPASVSGNIG